LPDDSEIIKSTVQGMVEGVMAPFAEVIADILGPASKTLGRLLNERAERFAKRIKEMKLSDRREINIERLSMNVLIPIIQNGLREQNDELQDRWAAILINTAVTGNEVPAAPDILRQLTALDVCLLQMSYDKSCDELDRHHRESQPFYPSRVEVTDVFEKWKGVIEERYGIIQYSLTHPPPPAWGLTESNVLRLGLLKEILAASKGTERDDETKLLMTELGFRFTALCQIPTQEDQRI
jgi:hypothetical protein